MSLLGALQYDLYPEWFDNLLNSKPKTCLGLCFPWNDSRIVSSLSREIGNKLYLGVGFARGALWRQSGSAAARRHTFPAVMFEMDIVDFKAHDNNQHSIPPATGPSGYFWDSSVLVLLTADSFSPSYWIYVKNESKLATSFHPNTRFNRGFWQQILNVR